jgi:hypothetical protein
MSLILDALRKLEREKDAREPNVLVVGSVPWGARARSRLPLVLALVGAGFVALAAFALWPRDRVGRTSTPAPPASTPAPAPTPVLSRVPPPATPASPADAAPPGPRRSSVPSPAAPAVEAALTDAETPDDEVPATTPAHSRPATSGTDELRLNAISERDGRPVALINDRLVFEGDGFDGVKVLRIGETEVEVEVRGVKKVLRF